MRRMSSATLSLEEFVSWSCSAKADSFVVSSPLSCQTFHVVMQERVEQERAERVTLLDSSLQMEVRVRTHFAAASYMVIR